ncbi:putative nuclease HARBI1 [Hydra vulgaris]|uniref:putative nuclease HARBI1 n=1 Tax=Hydra vulgaris TaxID=6087 RepID=UPI0032E9D147
MPRSIWIKPGSSETFWFNLLNNFSTENKWKLNFWMSKEHVMELANYLRPFINSGSDSPNYRTLSIEKKNSMLFILFKRYGITANAFGIHQCTVSKVVLEVCEAITYHLGPKIYLPKDKREMKNKVSEMETKFNMPQTHFLIRRPLESSQDYFNYKGFSISVQAICDSKGIFMDVDCKWPGSLHDAKVFSNSKLNSI